SRRRSSLERLPDGPGGYGADEVSRPSPRGSWAGPAVQTAGRGTVRTHRRVSPTPRPTGRRTLRGRALAVGVSRREGSGRVAGLVRADAGKRLGWRRGQSGGTATGGRFRPAPPQLSPGVVAGTRAQGWRYLTQKPSSTRVRRSAPPSVTSDGSSPTGP